MPGGTRKIAASRSAAASRRSDARKASPASARLGRHATSAHGGQRGRPGGGRRSTGAPSARTWQQLYQEAKTRNIKGRSAMTKAELERALGR